MRKQAFLLLLYFLAGHALSAQPDFPTSPATARFLSDSTEFYRCAGEGKMDSAVFYGKDIAALSIASFGEMSHSHAVALTYYIGYIYLYEGDARSAYPYLMQGVDVFTRLHDTTNSRYKNAVFYLGMAAFGIQALADADTYLSKAIEIFGPQAPDIYTRAQSMLVLGSVYTNKGEYERALSLYLPLSELVDTFPKDPFMEYIKGSLYNNLAIVYVQTGNPQKSLGFMQKALMTEDAGKKNGVIQDDYVQLLLNLAELYLLNGMPDSAMAQCRLAEDSLATDRGETKAKVAFLQSLILKEKASVYQHKKNRYAAIAMDRQYKAIVDSLADKPSNHEATMINLGILYTETRQYASADSLFRQEIGRLRQSGLTYSYELQQSIAGLCANLMDQKKYAEASDSLVNLIHLTLDAMKKNFAGMSESDQLQYKNGLNVVFDLLYTCLYSNRTTNRHILAATAGLELQRKSLILANQVYLLDKARHSVDTGFALLYTRWLNNRQLLSRQYSLPFDQRQFKVDSLEAQNETLESKLSAKGLTEAPPPPGYLVSRSTSRSADIEFVRFNYKTSTDDPDNAQYAAFIYLPGDSLPQFVHLCSESMLMKLLKDPKGNWVDGAQITQKIYDRSGTGAGALYHLLWQPMEPYLTGVTEVHYSTSGLLNNIAFHAVFNGKKYLYQRYTFHRHLSLLDASRQSDLHEPQKNISIWGNMNYDKAVNSNGPAFASVPAVSISAQGITTPAYTKGVAKGPLPSLGNTETDELKKIFADKGLPFTSYENEEASEDNFKRQAAAIKGVLHISTHGFYMPFRKGEEKEAEPGNFMAAIVNPLFRCGLAFSGINVYWLGGKARDNQEDGMLTGYEIAQLDLRQVELVTLSACETGLGDVTDDEGNLGLQRAFKLAGAGKLLVSLWQVPAKQTAELFSLFYTDWLEGKTINEALRSAQSTLQTKGYPPYYWAGFVLIE